METAKVDIRKLQLLNDRINQCIDALNQVRLSVHGLSGAATGAQGAIGATPGGFGLENLGLTHSGFGQNPFTQQGIGQQPFGPAPAPGYFSGFTPGVFPQQIGGAFGVGVNPYTAGLMHSSPSPIWTDPLLTARIVQTFPYAQLPIPPVVTVY